MPKKRNASRAKKPLSSRVLRKSTISKILARQKAADKSARLLKQAQSALKSFRPRKADRGRLVMVGLKGKRDPQAKGRKGYLVQVTKSGKKKLVKSHGDREFIARKISDIELPIRRNIAKGAYKEFETARREVVTRQIIKARGEVTTSGPNDFSESIVKKIARSVQKALVSQASHRTFLISANVLVRLPDGSRKVYQVQVPIARPDHIAIKIGGIENFIRKKFYAFMAKELAYDGFVSSGSANHIRHLKENYGVLKSNWENKNGEAWRGQNSEIVKIETIEWQIEQIK